MRQKVVEFVRRYVYLKREGFFDAGTTPDVLQYFDVCEPIVAMLVDECHIDSDEAREAYSRILLNGSENPFKLPALMTN